VFDTWTDQPALFQPNDRINFKAVTPEEFKELEQQPVLSMIKQAGSQ
jgi:allophanate hydrolase subunit 1